jgi:hypothetical protein
MRICHVRETPGLIPAGEQLILRSVLRGLSSQIPGYFRKTSHVVSAVILLTLFVCAVTLHFGGSGCDITYLVCVCCHTLFWKFRLWYYLPCLCVLSHFILEVPAVILLTLFVCAVTLHFGGFGCDITYLVCVCCHTSFWRFRLWYYLPCLCVLSHFILEVPAFCCQIADRQFWQRFSGVCLLPHRCYEIMDQYLFANFKGCVSPCIYC